MNPVMTRIMAVVGIIIGFVFMGLLYGYNEQLYAALSNHCNINSERVITVRASNDTDNNFRLVSNTTNAARCSPSATPSAVPTGDDAQWESANGTKIDFLSAVNTAVPIATPPVATYWVDGGTWESAPGLGGQFQTLTFLLIAVIPLALVAAVIAQAVPMIMSGGNSNVTDIVNKQTMGLLIAAAVIIAAPIMFEQAGNAKNDLVGLQSAAQFLTITHLIFDLVPLVYVIGVMGLIIYGSGLVQRFRGGQKMGGMMGM